MKVKKLHIDYEYDFELVGISSSVKAFKLAWAINNKIGINLKKAEDYNLKRTQDEKILIANYIFETEHSIFRLFKNRAVEGAISSRAYIVPEHPHFDYIAMKKGMVSVYDTMGMVDALKTVKFLEYITNIDITKLKSRENFLF